jgi:hypothetical protein
LVKIQDSLYKIKAPDNTKYSEGDVVYIKVPNGDLSSIDKAVDSLKESVNETKVSKIELAELNYIFAFKETEFLTGTKTNGRIPQNGFVHYGNIDSLKSNFPWSPTYGITTFCNPNLLDNVNFTGWIEDNKRNEAFTNSIVISKEPVNHNLGTIKINSLVDSLLENMEYTGENLVFSFNQYFDYTIFQDISGDYDFQEKYDNCSTYDAKDLNLFIKDRLGIEKNPKYDYGIKFYLWPMGTK